MKLETLRCNHCGGPLSVPESANFVTCNHCNSQLAIRRTESTTFTEELGEIKENQKQMMEQLAEIERQNRLEQIDRDWEREREKYLITNQHGRRSEPGEVRAVLGGAIMAIFGTFWMIAVFSIMNDGPSPGGLLNFFPLLGFIFITGGVGMAIYGYSKAKDYLAAERRYQLRRAVALGQRGSTSQQYGTVPSIPTPEEYLDQIQRDEHR
jgi:hypothetical protein